MRVTNLLLQSIVVDFNGRRFLTSKFCEFTEARWVSVHGDEKGRRVGPLTVLDHCGGDLEQLESLRITDFPPRELPLEPRAICYRDSWTIPLGTVYTLLPPRDFVVLIFRAGGGLRQPALEVATTPDGQLFYFTVFDYSIAESEITYGIEVRLECKPDESKRLVEEADTVEATGRFDSFRTVALSWPLSSDFWFKLVSLGTKLLGGS